MLCDGIEARDNAAIAVDGGEIHNHFDTAIISIIDHRLILTIVVLCVLVLIESLVVIYLFHEVEDLRDKVFCIAAGIVCN